MIESETHLWSLNLSNLKRKYKHVPFLVPPLKVPKVDVLPKADQTQRMSRDPISHRMPLWKLISGSVWSLLITTKTYHGVIQKVKVL